MDSRESIDYCYNVHQNLISHIIMVPNKKIFLSTDIDISIINGFVDIRKLKSNCNYVNSLIVLMWTMFYHVKKMT